ncbi:MAG: HIT family protein [Arenicellales bacterium]|nr:HIT family protein [Arenicellales bacterium]
MKTDEDCIFCKIVAEEIPCFKLYEDEDTLSFMDINPANEGHALVISKEHWRNVHVIPDELISAVSVTAKKIASALETRFSPDGINLVQCNGEGAAQSVQHFHMHVLPRKSGDELKLNWGLAAGDMDRIQEQAAKIASTLQSTG